MHCRFIYTVERLTAFYSALIDSLRATLLNALPQVGAMLQALLLDVLQRRAAKMSDLMTDMKPVLPSLLASHNHALQNNALRLLKVLLPAENDDSAGGVHSCRNPGCVADSFGLHCGTSHANIPVMGLCCELW